MQEHYPPLNTLCTVRKGKISNIFHIIDFVPFYTARMAWFNLDSIVFVWMFQGSGLGLNLQPTKSPPPLSCPMSPWVQTAGVGGGR